MPERFAALCLCGLAMAFCTGCPVVSNRPAPARVELLHEPVGGRAYYLYVPTVYREDHRWPLVVTCHGTRPFDTALAQMDEWKGVAEQRGFLVAAPELTASSAFTPAVEQQIARQMDDERAILSIVSHIRSGRSVDDTRIFLTGWSAGSYVVLFAGLRHPEVFRGLSVRQGNFKEEYLEPVVPFLDPHQAIQVTYGEFDLLRKDALACIDWLRAHDMDPVPLETFSQHRRDPEPVFTFFSNVVRNQPWVRLDLREDPADDMRVTLGARASFVPDRYLWDFGDGQRSQEAVPTHRYERPGAYTVRVALWGGGDEPVVRSIRLQVPRVRLGAALPASMPVP